MIGEVQEWRRCGPLFALKKHGDKRPKQNEAGCNLRAIYTGALADAVADSSVSYLIMILNETKEAMLRQIPYWPPMPSIAILANICRHRQTSLSSALARLARDPKSV